MVQVVRFAHSGPAKAGPLTKRYKSTTNMENILQAQPKTESVAQNSLAQPRVTTSNPPIELRAEVLVQPKIHTIKLESETDWPTVIATALVGVAGILTTLLVGWFAHSVQRNQIKSNVANFRHAWQVQLREKISDFVAKIAILHYRKERDPHYFSTPDSDTEYSDLLKIKAAVSLMLDPKKDYAQELSSLMEQCNSLLKQGSIKDLNEKVNELGVKANEILELAWNDIKSDLGIGS